MSLGTVTLTGVASKDPEILSSPGAGKENAADVLRIYWQAMTLRPADLLDVMIVNEDGIWKQAAVIR